MLQCHLTNNQRPHDYESGVLPAELIQQGIDGTITATIRNKLYSTTVFPFRQGHGAGKILEEKHDRRTNWNFSLRFLPDAPGACISAPAGRGTGAFMESFCPARAKRSKKAAAPPAQSGRPFRAHLDGMYPQPPDSALPVFAAVKAGAYSTV